MIKQFVIIFTLFNIFLFSVSCNKQNTNTIEKTDNKINKVQETEESIGQNFYDIEILPKKKYYGMSDTFAPDGKKISVYNNEIKETPWGPIYSPIIYLYEKDGEELVKYNIYDLISEDFWPGNIDIAYNDERNSFDLSFYLELGDYGAGYINLDTNDYIRESTYRGPTEEEILEKKRQNEGPEGYEEGSTLRKIDPTIFSLDPNNVNN